jgi:RNA polymerase sigma-54 factor
MDMKMGLHQGLYQKQQLVMTQRLQQALKLLQVPTLELEQILRQELQSNPLLEETDPDDIADGEDATEAESTKEESGDDAAAMTQETDGEQVDWDEYFKDGFRGAAFAQEYQDEDQIERPPVYVPTGQQDLTEQLHLAVDDELDRAICD